MPQCRAIAAILLTSMLMLTACTAGDRAPIDAIEVAERDAGPTLFPALGAREVNTDTPLRLTFAEQPRVGTSGKVRIYDAATNTLVDELDLAIPVSPNPTGRVIGADGRTKAPTPPPPAGPDNPGFQYQLIGGTYFHVFPIIVHGNTATIYPHHGKLELGREYLVRIDPGVLLREDGTEMPGAASRQWRFTTRATAPERDGQIVVAADGSADFNTVQGAVDFAERHPEQPVEILIENGTYEEIVVVNDRSNLTLRGQDREKVIVGYANNSAFNRVRPAFLVTNSTDIQLSNFTIRNYFIGQAEALLVRSERVVVDRMSLEGSGDAFTTYGTIYMVDSTLTGDGDTILAYAALYCLRCEVRSVGPFTWTRTPEGSHGNVFVDSTFIYLDRPLPWSITQDNPAGRKAPGTLARLPQNGPAGSPYANFAHAEMVLLNAKLDGVPPEGWGPIQEEGPNFSWENVRFWEFQSTDLAGRPIDTSKRHPIVRQLTLPADADLVAQYRDPKFVLDGWDPKVRSPR